MNFSYVVVVLLFSLTVKCNGQFKILGLLDTKSESNTGKVESIRSLVNVPEEFSADNDPIISSNLENVENVDGNAKKNVNYIKPFESSVNTSERNSNLVDATNSAIKNEAADNVFHVEETNNDSVHSVEVTDKPISGSNSDSVYELSTASSTTTISARKGYRSECVISCFLPVPFII